MAERWGLTPGCEGSARGRGANACRRHTERRRTRPRAQRTAEKLSQLLRASDLVLSCGRGDAGSPGDAAGTACSLARGFPPCSALNQPLLVAFILSYIWWPPYLHLHQRWWQPSSLGANPREGEVSCPEPPSQPPGASSAASLRRASPAPCHPSLPLAACPLVEHVWDQHGAPRERVSHRSALSFALRPGLRFGGRSGKGPGPNWAKLGKAVCARRDGRSSAAEPRGRSLQKRALNQVLPVPSPGERASPGANPWEIKKRGATARVENTSVLLLPPT